MTVSRAVKEQMVKSGMVPTCAARARTKRPSSNLWGHAAGMAPGTTGQVPPPTKKMRPETLGEVRERAQAVYGMDCDSPSSSDESPDPESTTPWGQENDKDHVLDKDDTDDGECIHDGQCLHDHADQEGRDVGYDQHDHGANYDDEVYRDGDTAGHYEHEDDGGCHDCIKIHQQTADEDDCAHDGCGHEAQEHDSDVSYDDAEGNDDHIDDKRSI